MTKAVEEAHTNAQLITVLRPEQHKALELVLRGLSDYEVAKELKLRRETICRWRNQDATFRALLQKKRAEMLDLSAAQLQGMAGEATRVVMRAIHSTSTDNDPRANQLTSSTDFDSWDEGQFQLEQLHGQS